MRVQATIDKEVLFDRIGYSPHGPEQWEIHNSTARFIIPCCGRRFGKSQAAGHEMTHNLFIPDSMWWIVGPCVDDKTEILTARGWLNYQELKKGDLTLTLNMDGKAEWQPVEDIHTYTGYHSMIHINQRGHDSLTTPHHRWLVGYTGRDRSDFDTKKVMGYRFTTTAEMTKANECVLGGAQVINLPTELKVPDSFVELVAWYWTEGTDRKVSDGILISQNEGNNTIRIKEAALASFGESSSSSEMLNRYDETPRWSGPRSLSKENPQQKIFSFNSHAGRLLRSAAPDKVVSTYFVTSLTKHQLELLIETSVKADGHERYRAKSSGEIVRERVIVQDRKDRLDTIQMACQLAGYQTTLLYDESGERWRLSIFERSRMWLGQKASIEKRTTIDYYGTVWCPQTANGTWLARRNGTVYFTGNTYKLGEKEFRVVHSDLKKLNILDKCRTVNYNVNQGQMRIETPMGSILEVVSSQKADSLVGEGLNGVIMSEAAKHLMSTWQMYIEPALSDHRGSAIFPSTPQGFNWYKGLYDMGQMPEFPDYESWRFPTWDNAAMYPGGFDDPELARIRQSVSKQYWEQEYAAEFTSFEGQIYPDFDESLHVRVIDYVPAWRNYQVFDFGYIDPFVCLDIMVDEVDNVYIWREYQVTHLSTWQHANIIKNRDNPHGFHVDLRFGDPSGADEIATLELVLGHVFAERVAREQGYEAIRRWLKPLEGPPKLFIDPNCIHLLRQLPQLRKKEIKEGHNEKPGQYDFDDHGPDALRYFFEQFFVLGRSMSLESVYTRDYRHSEAAGFFTYASGIKLSEDIGYG